MRLAVLSAVLLGLAASASAQTETAAVFGTVVDETGAPLPGVNVYFSGTTQGGSTDVQGRFRIADVRPGAYRVVASFIGFTTAVEDVRVRAGRDVGPLAFRLAPTAVEGGAAVVEAEGDARWQRRYAQFKRTLVGESENATRTDIDNPWVLQFRSRFGALTAEGAEPLVVVNRALGYRLTYDLREFEATETRVRFDGEERFELLTPADAAEAARWETARALAYRGSLRHLLQALGRGTAEAEGFAFTVRRLTSEGLLAEYVGRPVAEADVVVRVDSAETGAPGWYRLTVDGALGVTYRGEPEVPAYLTSEWFRGGRSTPYPYQESILVLADGQPALIDPKGTPADPFAVQTSGYLAFERLGDLVPEEYVLPASTARTDIQSRRPPRGSGASRDR